MQFLRAAVVVIPALCSSLLLSGCGAVDELSIEAGAAGTIGRSVHGLSVIPDHYIVVLKPGASRSAVAADHAVAMHAEFDSVLNGFAAMIPAARLRSVKADARVAYLEPDQIVSASAQELPSGIARIEGDQSSTISGNGGGTVDVGVAIIDTGIDTAHPDLNVAGGINFVQAPLKGNTKYKDGNGHGTHCAGVVGALDNGVGVVGVAPGARLYAVRVLDNNGSGSNSGVIAGVNWVTKNAAILNIRVVNMSLGGGVSSALDTAVANSIAAGITYAVAAGNENADASTSSPARVPTAITVSAVADKDGIPGGLAGAFLRDNSTSTIPENDDTLATFSNYGALIDLAAPGVNISSTWLGGSYRSISGTSMAAPHVAGAAALYASTHPDATPAQIRDALVAAASLQASADGFTADRDGFAEPLLKVLGF